MYMSFVDDDRADRHLSLIPHFAGSEALCGQRIAFTERVTWDAAMHMVTCRDCAKACAPVRQSIGAGQRLVRGTPTKDGRY